MSRTRRYLSGLFGNYLNQLVVLLVSLWLTRFLLGRLGQEQYGLWLIVFQVLTFLDLTDLGVVALLPREVAYRTGSAAVPEERTAAVSELLGVVRRVSLWQVPLVVAAAVLLWALLLDSRVDHPAALPLALAVLCYLVLFPLRMYSAALQGHQDQLFLGVANTATWLAQSSLTVALIFAGLGFWSLAYGWAFGRCLHTLLCWCRLQRSFQGSLPRRLLGHRTAEAGRLLRSGLWVSLSNLAVGLHYGAEVLILGQLLGPAPVVVYVCTMRLVTLSTFQICSLVTVGGPALSELRQNGSPAQLLRASTALGQLILLTSGLACCVLLMTNAGFVTWWVGADRYGGEALTLLLLAVMLVRHMAFVLSQVLLCLGQERNLALIILIDGLLIVGTVLLLTPWCGLLAAPLGSLLGVGLVSLPIFVYLLLRQPGFSLGALIRAYWPWGWRFAILAGALWWLSRTWAPSGLVQIALAAVGISAVYALVMFSAIRQTPIWVYLDSWLAPLRNRLQTGIVAGAWFGRTTASGECKGLRSAASALTEECEG